MRADARLDSAVFWLTPTRTRCDLVIISDGKKEKVASGLLSPFLAHLKSAQDQMEKGGYSITLQPDPDSDVAWFTRGTVERFVRFVSTPEILERVNTIESEILQIDEAITIQNSESLGLATQVEVHPNRSVDNIEGGRAMVAVNDADKAIVLYKPGADPPQTNGSDVVTENSKVQLMKVLETRRTVLQKEQGMAFARAVAAGFEMENMPHLVSFSECFGAARLLVACMKFMELWKRKHETGQWFQMEATEAFMRSDLSPLNVSGIVLSGVNADRSIELNSIEPPDDRRISGSPQVPLAQHDYPPGQFQHPLFHQWPVHSSPGAPVFPSYTLQGMPYYPNYPNGSPFFQSPCNQSDDPRYHNQRRSKKKKHSMDSKDSSNDSDAEEAEVSTTRSADRSEAELSEGKSSRKRTSKAGKRRSGVVVIRNINYIASKRHGASGSEQESDSNSALEEETDNSHRQGKGSSRSKAGKTTSRETINPNDSIQGQDTDGDNWKVFQSFLLRSEEKSSDPAMFSNEKGFSRQRQPNTHSGVDPILQSNRESTGALAGSLAQFDQVDGRIIHKSKGMAADGGLISSTGQKRENQSNVEFGEIEGGRTLYRHKSTDDLAIYGRETQPTNRYSLDPLAENGVGYNLQTGDSSQTRVGDESFLVPSRSHWQDSPATSRGAIYADTVMEANGRELKGFNDKRNPSYNEPRDLSLMPERNTDGEPTGYDPAIYYDMTMQTNRSVKRTGIQVAASSSGMEGSKSDKMRKTRASQPGQERKTLEATRRARPSKLNPLAEAQARAEKLRAFKADLQKAKREKEEEEIKRLDALKRERQRRIAARGAPSGQQGSGSLQARSQAPVKVSSNLNRGSKFTDSEPASASPLQKFSVRRASTGSSIPQKILPTSKLSSGHPSRNGLSKSASSLTALKRVSKSTVDKKTTSVTRRLSDPKHGVSQPSAKLVASVQGPKPSTLESKGNVSASSLLKSQKMDRHGKKNIPEEPQIKKISAIISLDKSKAASLPELKLRMPTMHTNVATKSEMMCTGKNRKGEQSTQTPESFEGKNATEKVSLTNDGDEGHVIEKTVVMFERETISAPVVASHEITLANGNFRKEKKVELQSKVVSGLPPFAVNTPLKDPIKGLPPKLPTYEAAKDLQKASTSTAEKPYQAPHARLSSMESISDLDHSGLLRPTISEVVKKASDTTQTQWSTSTSADQPPEISEKPRVKEPKGLKKLLKFGKKSHSSANEEHNMDPSGSSSNNAIPSATPYDVPSLKHLMSEEDLNTGSTPPKASRSFSILSPFRIKSSSEKKITA